MTPKTATEKDKTMKVTMIMGAPASGKSTLAEQSMTEGCCHLNRDNEGDTVISLLPKMIAALKAGKDVVIDNLFAAADSRKPFLEVAKKMGAHVVGKHMTTSIEDSQINALHRMWDRYGRIFYDAKQMKGIKDPGLFPVAVLFMYRKQFEKPVLSEGFDELDAVRFVRRPSEHSNKAIIFDYDGTLRTSSGDYVYPIRPSDVVLMPNRIEVLASLREEGHLLLGVSNQSGVGKGVFSDKDARSCFDKTNSDLGIDIDYVYCNHKVPPSSCYCRKPQAGLGVHLIRKYKLDPAQCTMVGDRTTDKTFAKRLGFQYQTAEKFFQ